MESDEDAIRNLVATWHAATAAGDVARILPLMADDVVFLTAGNPPMRGRHGFEEGLITLLQRYRINSSSQIREIEISGNLAYCWSFLTVTVSSLDGRSTNGRVGDALTILRKQPDGDWVVVRDANMLAANPQPSP